MINKILVLENPFNKFNIYTLPYKDFIRVKPVNYLIINKKQFLTDKEYKNRVIKTINLFYELNRGYFINQYKNRLKIKPVKPRVKKPSIIKPVKPVNYYYTYNQLLKAVINKVNKDIKTYNRVKNLF